MYFEYIIKVFKNSHQIMGKTDPTVLLTGTVWKKSKTVADRGKLSQVKLGIVS